MRFMALLKASAAPEAGGCPDPSIRAAIGRYTRELRAAGVLVHAGGLHADADSARVKLWGAARIVIDGPFAEPAERVAGYWMLDVASREEAIEWVKRCPSPPDGEAEVELRRILDEGECATAGPGRPSRAGVRGGASPG